MQLQPYLFFGGTCAAAIDFYKVIFGGSAVVTRIGDTPAAAQFPHDRHDRVMHATFTAPGVEFMASDGMDAKEYAGGNVSMSIGTADVAEGEKVFAALSEGGKVTKPMEKQFWGAHFGEVTDRYGIDWMINAG